MKIKLHLRGLCIEITFMNRVLTVK